MINSQLFIIEILGLSSHETETKWQIERTWQFAFLHDYICMSFKEGRMEREYICIQLLVIYFPLEILSEVYNENFSRVSQSIHPKQCFQITHINCFALVGRNNWAEFEQWIKNDTMSSIAIKMRHFSSTGILFIYDVHKFVPLFFISTD